MGLNENQTANHVGIFCLRKELNPIMREIMKPYLINNIPITYIGEEAHLEELISSNIIARREENTFYPTRSNYGKNNEFDKEVAISNLKKMKRSSGPNPYVLIGSLQSLDNYKDSFDEIISYEHEANKILSDSLSSTFCLFATDDLEPDRVQDLLEAHPYRITSEQSDLGQTFGETSSKISTLCMVCKKIHLKDGSWQYQQGSMIPMNTENYSHGVCDACVTLFKL